MFRNSDQSVHPATSVYLREMRTGQMSRREFLSRVTGLGVSAALATRIAGLPGPARAATPKEGGTLRIQQNVKGLGEPRSFDWSEMGNLTRGFLEYLIEYRDDGTFHGMLLDHWEVNEDATRYVLHLRPGIRWSNGDPLTTEDIVRNVRGWCDSSVPGNSMTSRMASLVDEATGQMREGAVRALDETRVELTLPAPDITLIAGMSDYPAAITHVTYTGGDPFAHGIGTGPFRPVELIPGERCVLERDANHPWWGSGIFGGPYLERIEFIDLGTDPANWAEAARNDEIDLLYESVGDFIDVMSAQGWVATSTESAATLVIRANQNAAINGETPYADLRVRRALQLAVDNGICLELGYADRGTIAEDHHISPLHPAYADIGPSEFDPARARAELAETEYGDYVHELITIDDEWQRNTGDAVAALLNDAGIRTERKILPGAQFWPDWTRFAFSATAWNHRPLGVQVPALAYRSGAVWNESGFANAEFDAALAQAMSLADAGERRVAMRRMEEILRENCVIIQPFWRKLYNHHNGRLINAEKHPSNEIHLYKIGFAA